VIVLACTQHMFFLRTVLKMNQQALTARHI